MNADEAPVAKWFTRARKIPQLVGRMPDGRQLWGGPYTLTQIVAGLVVFFLGYATMPMWGTGKGLFDVVVLLGAGGLAIFAFGRLPLGSRNPLHIVAGIWSVLTRSRAGYVNGRPAAFRRKPPGMPLIRAYRLRLYSDSDTAINPAPETDVERMVMPPAVLTETQTKLALAVQRKAS